jgi:hypothetical protein
MPVSTPTGSIMAKKAKENAAAAFIRRYQWLLLAVLLAVLICPAGILVGYSLLRGRSESQQLAPFASHIDEYLTAPKKTASGAKARSAIVPIDVAERTIDRLYFELPERLRAPSPEAVATVVWLKWREEQLGKYESGAPACIEFCDVTVIDRAQSAVVADKQFKGGDPPKVLRSSLGKGVGKRPYKEIADYLTALCDR